MTTLCKICSQSHTNFVAPGIIANVCSDRKCIDIVISETFIDKYSGSCIICNQHCGNYLICESNECSDALLIMFSRERTKFRYHSKLASLNRLKCCKCHMSFHVLPHTDITMCKNCVDNNIIQVYQDNKKRRYNIKDVLSMCTTCCCVFNLQEVIPLLSQVSDHYYNNPKCFNCLPYHNITPLAEFWNVEYSRRFNEMQDSEANSQLLQRHQAHVIMDVD